MPRKRKARIDAPGALHDIIIRGIERKAIFKGNVDRDIFLERLGRIISELRPVVMRVKEARRVLCYIAVRKLGYKCTDVSKSVGLSAVTVSKAVSPGSKLSEVGKIQKQILDN